MFEGQMCIESAIQEELPIIIGTFPVLSNICLKGLPPINGNANTGLNRSPSVDELMKFTLEIDDDKKIPRSVSVNKLDKYEEGLNNRRPSTVPFAR